MVEKFNCNAKLIAMGNRWFYCNWRKSLWLRSDLWEPVAQNNFSKLSNLVWNAAKTVAEKGTADVAVEVEKVNLMLRTQLRQ